MQTNHFVMDKQWNMRAAQRKGKNNAILAIHLVEYNLITFHFLFARSDLLMCLGSSNEEGKDSTKSKNVDELLTVLDTIDADHGMIEDFKCTRPRHLLLTWLVIINKSGIDREKANTRDKE